MATVVMASQSIVYDLAPNLYHDNCFFITNLNHSFIDYKSLYISVHAMGKKIQAEGKEEVSLEYAMNVVLLNERDIAKTTISGNDMNHCTLEMMKEEKCHEEKVALIDVDQELKDVVANVILESNGANLLVYPIQETGWYCTFIKIHSDLQEEFFPVRFEIQQSFGELTVHGYEELETSVLLVFLYLLVGLAFKCYNYFFVKSLQLKDYNLLLKINKFLKVQDKLYKYCVIDLILNIVTVTRYSIINVTNYNHDYITLAIFHFLELSANTLFAVWIIYELLLFSDGFIVCNNSKNTLINIIATRGLTILVLITFILFDLEESTIFSVQSYLLDFVKPIAERNEFNMDINEIFGWVIYSILLLVFVKLVANTLNTIKVLKYKNPKWIKKFQLTMGVILLAPFCMMILPPILNKLDYLNNFGSFWSNKYFVFTRIPYQNFINVIIFGLVCWIWKGADLSLDKDDEEEEGEEFIELNKL